MLTLGDLAHSLVMRANQTRLKAEVQTLTEQVTTGQQTDLADHFSGNLMTISAVERSLVKLDAFALANTEVKAKAETMQSVLGTIDSVTGDLTTEFLKIDLATTPAVRQALAAEAEQAFSAIVAGLNTQMAGRSLFAGAATDRAALAGTEEIIDRLRQASAGAITFEDLNSALDDWFDRAGGPFETVGYLGSSRNTASVALSDTERVALPVRADDPLFRTILKAMAMGQLAMDPTLNLTSDAQKAALRQAGNLLLNAKTGLVELRSELGAAQERIEDTMARNSAERSATIITRNALIEADPYEAATRLSAVQYQLEGLYTITARNRSLSLVEFLR